ncbi:16S rRNA (guanine527-N7)-methyltransferase [Entomoplasma ellychniae]|uniref:Ribosomal RNA small subunit methyltransferase G n=1 Tax=Entomoplasma ellychniae TaxID=2114 RepID=A0A8E2QW49_9MOLU|nr:16S rRNA (guanine(527)-N(7))-methyltransferase RsmG [Entomoplasma ellychniae]PPE04782.1 16S rRNA (guanine527-N7)-methyltransferase [Entomoplasma ellychniae]
MPINWSVFKSILNIDINSSQQEQLLNFYEILKQENKKHNLTRVINFEEVFYKHFLDCLVFTQNIKLNDQKIIDIGSGAGFPGIVLKIIFPNTKITLLDSNNKKISFLNKVINDLKLVNIRAVHERAEALSRIENEEYDIVISRAVAYLDVILELSVRFAKKNGKIILLKGPRGEQELASQVKLAPKLNLKLDDVSHFYHSEIGKRINVFFTKVKETPELYPREYAKIVKESTKNNA